MPLPREWESGGGEAISFDDALHRVLDSVTPLSPVVQPLLESYGYTLAQSAVSSIYVPPFDNSAMDGYAVRADDTLGSVNLTFNVIETIAAGNLATRVVGNGEAARIMTGAPMPLGADAVIRFEDTDEDTRPADQLNTITLLRSVKVGENVRTAGEILRNGEVILSAGTTLGPHELGLLAAAGMNFVSVHPRPRVGILSTGNELVSPGSSLGPGQIFDSNASLIHSLVRQAGGEPWMLGIAADTHAEVHSRLHGMPTPHMFVTSGGVSVGDYDVVKDILKAEGRIDVMQVRMKPGRPLAFGMIHGVPLLGLPGNTFAAMVAFLQFGRPLIRRMMGRSDLLLSVVEARLTQRIMNSGNRRQFVRGVLSVNGRSATVRPHASRTSDESGVVEGANCLIVLPEELIEVAEDSMVLVQLFDEARP